MVFWGHFLKALVIGPVKLTQSSQVKKSGTSVYEQFTFITIWCKYIHYFMSKYNEVQ